MGEKKRERGHGHGHVYGAVLVGLLGFCACAGAPVPPPKPAAPIPPAVPDCPDAIARGGDALAAEAFAGKSIARVCLVGGSEASRKTAQRIPLLRAGETFTAERIRADLDGLMKLGIFEDASAFGLPTSQGAGSADVVLLYSLRDRPRIADIAFEGAKVLGNAALAAKLPLAKGSPYDPLRVHAAAQGVRDEYRARGYEGCRVVLVAEPVTMPGGAPDQVSVRIKVDEGPQWRLSKLEIRGNKKVSEADLRKASGLTVGQPFVKDEVERATLTMSALLYDRGLITMRLEPEQGPVDATGNVPLAYVIEEGDVHTIRALHVTNLGAPIEKEILEKVMHTRPKQIFNRALLVEDMARVKEHFQKRGQTVVIEPRTEIDAKNHTVEVTLDVEAR